MEMDEAPHAMNLVLGNLSRLEGNERLKVMFDVDDTSADTNSAVLESMGITVSSRGKVFYNPEIKLEDYVRVYHRVWQERPLEIKPKLSRESVELLLKRTEFHFISAREKTTEEGLLKWISHYYHGLDIPVILVSPVPYSMHGFHKLQQDLHVLVDDSPPVAESMVNGYAKGRSLLLMDKWEESVARRNKENTAVVPNAEIAARYILNALDIHEHGAAQRPKGR